MNLNSITSLALPLINAISNPDGMDRPLWGDYSYWQEYVDFEIAKKNGMHGAFSRATSGYDYIDPTFQRNWLNMKRAGLLRASYHLFKPDQNVVTQLDNWYAVNPEIDIIPRAIDLEVSNGVGAEKISNVVNKAVEICKSRDGVYPIIYSRYALINSWLSPYWTVEMLNRQYYWLAQYLYDRVREHPGNDKLTIPNKVNRENVILHQTADKKPGFPGEVESAARDYDRWEIGNEVEMYLWIDAVWGDGTGTTPPTNDCEAESKIAYDLGYSEGKEAGINEGFDNGWIVGYNDALEDSLEAIDKLRKEE